MTRTKIAAALACALLAGCAGSALADNPQARMQPHIDRATRIAGEDLKPMLGLCKPTDVHNAEVTEELASQGVTRDSRQAPMRIFDNLYFVGNKSVSAWAITTPEGIILIDALHDNQVEDQLVGGLSALGLEPGTIRYVIVTHGHSDHYGGSKFLQEKYGARIVMGARDWDAVLNQTISGAKEPPPRRDMDAPARLTLGGATITLLDTPGHTPGAVSLFFTVRDGAEEHSVALLGGAGFPRTGEAMRAYVRSAERFRAEATRRKVDVIISNHPNNDGSIPKMKAVANRRPGQPHPFLTDPALSARQVAIARECAAVNLIRLEAAGK